MSGQQNMPVLRHALSGNTRIYYTKTSANAKLESKASKTLALKWFQDWKKFQKIQPGKSYAQALIVGRELNLGPVNLKIKQHNVASKQASKTVKLHRDKNCNKNKPTVPSQVNSPTRLQCGRSVAGGPSSLTTPVQVEIKNRFQVFQDTLDQELCEDQWGHSSRVISKQAKSHNKDKVASITKNVKQDVPNPYIENQCQPSSLQQTQGTKIHRHNVQNLQKDDDVVDRDSHVTDYHMGINGNCEPYNNVIPQTGPKNIKNTFGTAIESGMCVEKQKCIAQTGGYFGFVPETSLKLYQGSPVHWEDIPTILEAHKLVRSSGTHNYLKCRIPVNSHLKIDKWAYYLRDYWDQQIVDLLHYGFPLDFSRNSPLRSTYDNHTSAITDIEHVRQYVKEELQYEAIIGPFDTVPCTLHSPPPLMTRAKQDSDKNIQSWI